MEKPKKPTTVLDVSKALGYGLLYNPVIGNTAPTQYPFIGRFRPRYRLSERK